MGLLSKDDPPKLLNISSYDDYYLFSNYLNHGSNPFLPQKLSNTNSDKISIKIPDIDERITPSYQKLKDVFGIAKRKSLIKNLIVHGSHGDKTNCNYSDIDLTLVINDTILESFSKLEQLRKWLRNDFLPILLSFDPLQHHGPFFLWENLVGNYIEEILPIDVYSHSWAMEPITIDFNIQKNAVRSKHIALKSALNLQNESKFFSNGYTMFAMKRYLSNLMLIPALYWSDIGKPMFKADSFQPFYDKFGPASNPIKIASKIREDWPSTPSKTSKAIILSSGVRGGLEVSRLLYHDEKISKIIVEEIMPLIGNLVESLEGN